VRWTLLLVVLFLAGVGVVTALQARTAYTHLKAVEASAPRVREEVRSGDAAGLRRSVVTLRQDTRVAKEAVDGWQWTLLGKLPWVGADFHAVQAVGEASHLLAAGALRDLADVSETLKVKDLQPVGGRFDTAPLKAAQPQLAAAAQSAREADDLLSDVHPADLDSRIRARVQKVIENAAALRSATDTAARASELLPDVLGASGPRNYLLLVQNNAEPRALGGIAGSYILLHTENGKVRLVTTRPASSFDELAQPVLPLTPGESGLYGTLLARFAQNVTGTPDFPRAAQFASALWEQKTKTKVDGVAAIDPVALGALLRATGPVTLPDGRQLTEQNAAPMLLNQVYFDLPDVEAQDRFFGAAAASIFTKVTSGPLDAVTGLDVLSQMTREGRLLFWSANQQDQRQVAGTRVAGELRGSDGDSPVLGVYLHDRTQAKVAYYEDMDVKVVPKSCRGDLKQYTLSVTLTSHVPDNVNDLGTQTGLGKIVPVGQIASQVFTYAPKGGFFSALRVSKGDTAVSRAKHDGLDAVGKQVTLLPGDSVTLEYDVSVPATLRGPLEVRSTPGPGIGRFDVTTTPCTA
jgi:hypothetical protein